MANFWKNKKVLITGNTGFKGSWLTLLLNEQGAKLYGISKKFSVKEKKSSLFFLSNLSSIINTNYIDICDFKNLYKKINHIKPDVIFHLAAQAIVSESYDEPLNTFYTNTIGTVNILECIKNINKIKTAIIVTSDKVYKNTNSIYPYNEESILGGADPYSSSKSAAELITFSYSKSFLKNNKNIATVRAGNIIGGGDWSKDRIIPDLIRSWSNEKKLIIRNAKHIRPWQHVLDPLSGYVLLAEHIHKKSINYDTFNFGPKINETFNVKMLINESLKYFDKKIAIKYNKKNKTEKKEENKIFLETIKSEKILNFQSKYDFYTTVKKTIEWYINFYNGHSPLDLCKKDITDYLNYKSR